MITYAVLNLVFLGTVVALLYGTGLLKDLARKPIAITAAIILGLTAIFDSVIIALGLVTYDTTKILGVYIGKAPIEDFAYAVLVVILVPALWQAFRPKSGDAS